MELYIGINFYSHDTAVFILDSENQTPFAISMERLTRFKHDIIFPVDCIDKYISYRKIDVSKVKNVFCGNSKTNQMSMRFRNNYYEFEMFKREVFGESYIKGYKKTEKEFESKSKQAQYLHLLKAGNLRKYRALELSSERRFQIDIINDLLKSRFPNAEIKIDYFDHEECHAISSYVTSPFNNEAVLITMDGHGDNNHFSKVFIVKDGKYELVSQSTSPERFMYFTTKYNNYWDECSIGGMYSYFTYQLGFTPNADEGKVEALAAFGNHENEIFEKLKECFTIENNFIGYPTIRINKELAEIYFSLEAFSDFKKKYKKEDISAAVQIFLEEIMSDYIKRIIDKSGITNLCVSGGIFANVILNLKVYEEITKSLHIIPAMADDGSAEGACYMAYMKNGKTLSDLNWLKSYPMPYWGTSYERDEILETCKKYSSEIVFEEYDENWPEKSAERVSEGQIGALFHGRMEWGPRALGNRSIIADTRFKDVTEKINKSIKNRPLFQPFCPSILEEERERLFGDSYSNKHMTTAFRIKDEFRNEIPASTHIDGTARAQFVSEKDNPMFHRYLKEMKRLTGFGVSINTSFNKHGRTIVETPENAIRDFLDTNLDFMYLEGIFITRK